MFGNLQNTLFVIFCCVVALALILTFSDGVDPERNSEPPRYVLAFSWQPAFCETRPNKPECISQTEDRFDAKHFSLHGLWPQPRARAYCNVAPDLVALDKDGKWTELPELELNPDTLQSLEIVMPGMQSGLERHEWYKHGTCYSGKTAEQYFADSLALMDVINKSPIRDLFAGNIGVELQTADIQTAFSSAFGQGAGERIRVACRDDGSRRIITEITLGLAGDLKSPPDLTKLIAASPPVDSGCPRGIVDAVGLQ